jgi:hypothetical protein
MRDHIHRYLDIHRVHVINRTPLRLLLQPPFQIIYLNGGLRPHRPPLLGDRLF